MSCHRIRATTLGPAPLTYPGTHADRGKNLLWLPTPEPSSLLLSRTGLLGLAFVAFRKAKSTGMALSM